MLKKSWNNFLFFREASHLKLSVLLFNLPELANALKSFLLLLTKWTMTVISIHPILTGPAIKTRVTLTVIDDGITRFAWVHRTTQIKMDGVADNTGKTPEGNTVHFPHRPSHAGLSSPHSSEMHSKEKKTWAQKSCSEL